MEERLSNLKTDFIKIVEARDNNITIFEILHSRVLKIKENYSEFIKNNKEHLFIFTLDSFHFQGKLIDIEYEDMKRLFYAIMNKMYCEYYKLYKIIIDYIYENVSDKKIIEIININSKYPDYKDLEPFKQYDFKYIQEIHENIIVILNAINGHLLNKEHDLKIYQNKNNIGFNIDNFVNTFNFNNVIMREKVILFITYMEFFHKMHTKYLTRFTTKIQLMLSQINHDIKFDNPQDEKMNHKNVIKKLKEDNIDKNIIKELKFSIDDFTDYSSDALSVNTSDTSSLKDSPHFKNKDFRRSRNNSQNSSFDNDNSDFENDKSKLKFQSGNDKSENNILNIIEKLDSKPEFNEFF